ncbi:synaptonemal complex protein 1-like isoform X2 [Cucurbita maxima]|uniref:Synaptonemal complex protein 1-like isoform X2 n=1 Tax=Cucurbita maxima TaxID=3661 RepID=A0A6J1KTU5_CUCMA|nr:synaptonemal complex protein 1-like isoform X2 [Cucurbita maxima]
MFRLHRNRQAKSGEKIDFKFSNFKALQVPKGWDKLFISVVSEQTGKTIVRSSKASVRNGGCQWTESLSESIWVSQDEISKEFEDCNFKLVVAMGSARSNILGEAMVNMTNYIDSKSSSAVSLPLKKCNHGTNLQVKIQCLTPITKVRRSGELKQTNSSKENLKKEGHDSDSCSDITDSQLSRSIGSSSGADLYSSLHSGEGSSKEASFSASYSQLSNDSSEVYESVENDAAKNNYSDMQRQDSVSSQNSLSPNSVITGSAEATTVLELRAEAKLWEKNAHKLMADLDQLKKEFSDQSQHQESLNSALSAANAECDGLRKELEQLKLVTENSTQRQTIIEDFSYQNNEPLILNELKDELKFLKETNADLAEQLKRSQESNIELVSVLQELEETTEKQRLEIGELLARHRKDNDIENIIQENKELMLQLERVKESEKNLQLKVGLLERNLEETNLRNLEETNFDLEKCKVSNQRFPQDIDKESDGKLHSEEELRSLQSVNTNLVKEIEMLKEKVQELEKDCNELTDENIDLLYKLKQANNDAKGGGLPFNSSGGKPLSNSFVNFGFDTMKHKNSTQNLEVSPEGIENNDSSFNQKLESAKFELEVKVEELSRELTEKQLEIEKLESSILSKEDEIKILGDLHTELQAKYANLQKEKHEIEEQMEVILGESNISSKCINDLRNEVKELRNSVDLHDSVKSKCSELECEKREFELHVSQMEQERIQLSERISVLESQLKYMKDEKESVRLELENSKSRAVGLQDEVDRLRLEIEKGSVDLKQMLNDVQNQCAEAQDQCEYLQREKDLVQKSNGELKKKNFELHERYLRLESKLKESLERSAHYSKKVDDLEQYLSLGLEDFASKERLLSSELSSIVEDNIKYKEKFAMFESLYNETYLEKATEAQELQGAVVHLTKQLSSMKNDLNIMQMESDEKLTALINELSVSKQSQGTLIVDHEKLLKQLENYKSLEVKLKNSVNDLELKLSVSEKERKQHEEELTNLKVKMAHFQDEVSESRNKLEQKIIDELEESKQSEVALKENVLRIGSESVVKEASFTGNDDLSNELYQIKRVNSKYQQKPKILDEKDECLKRCQYLEAELRQLKEEKRIQRESSSVKVHGLSKTNGKNTKLLINDAVKTVGQNLSGKKKPASKTSQSHEQVKDRKDFNSNQSHSQVKDDSEYDIPEAESVSRIQLLEKELAEALGANKKYEDQLSRLVSDNQNNKENSPISLVEGDAVAKERYESINSALEAELRDIRERYFHISLKYAEVEQQREELVMKLKATKSGGRRWFS